MRIGQSKDVHRLAEGRELVLGGVHIPYEKGLLGHSDADALLHAIIESLIGAMGLKLTPAQRVGLQNMVNQGYELFTKRCADGRHVTQDSIKKIAEGRVWDGMTAKQIGLVDDFGGIREAVAWVANKAKMGKDYKTQNYPTQSDKLMEMLDKYMVSRYEARLRGEMGLLYDWHKQLQRIMGRDQVLCLMPEGEIRL